MRATRFALRGASSRAAHLSGWLPGLAMVLAAFAYRALFLAALRPAGSAFEQWFFVSEQGSPLLPIGIGAWMLVRRWSRLRALPDRVAPAMASALLAAGVGLFAWACLAGERPLLLPSLAANLLAFAGATRGRAGCRAALLPALVLSLGVPIPAPLRDEIVWRLQVASASGATWLLQAAGADAFLGGVQIHSGDYAFTVIETCSGLRGIEILTLIALAIRELFAASGWRSWIVVGIAPWLGFALNVLRIVAVVASAERAGADGSALESWDHTPQGIAVLVAGTASLYALGRGLAGPAHPGGRGDGQRVDAAGPSRRMPRRELRAGALLVLAVLAILSLTVAPLPRVAEPPLIKLPFKHAGWTGEDLILDRLFVGQFQPGEVLQRRYQRARGRSPQIVELLVGYEASENTASRLLSPKLLVPDHDWSLVDARSTRLWLLGLDARSAVASRDSELVLVYLWRLRDEGIWRETWRAAWALDVGPWRRERRRVVVRLTTPLANDGPAARDRAKRTLDRFVGDFRSELAGL
jgi:exosortase